MSHPLFRAQLQIFQRALALTRPSCYALLTPQAVMLQSGGNTRLVVPNQSNLAKQSTEQLNLAVNMLLQMLDAERVSGKKLHVVISDDWALPAVLPRLRMHESDLAIDAAIGKHYRETYGEFVDGWHSCWDISENHVVAVAWPKAATNALKAGLDARDCILSSARPLGMDVYNALVHMPNNFWLTILLQQCVTLIRVQNGAFQDWSVIHHIKDMAVDLPMHLAREAARRADACRALVVVDLSFHPEDKSVLLALENADWNTRVASAHELSKSVTWRLIQMTAQKQLS